MTRITKDLAANVATQMTKAKQDYLNEVKKEISEIGYTIAKSTVSKEIISMYEKNKDYFRNSSYINLHGTGLNHYHISFTDYLPSKNGSSFVKTVDDKTANKITKLDHLKQKKQEEISQLKREIEIALYNLRTYKNVEKNFIEAFKFLPKSNCTTLVVNINSIREKL